MYDVVNTIVILFLLFIISTWFIIFMLGVKDKLVENSELVEKNKNIVQESCPKCEKEIPIIHIDVNNDKDDDKDDHKDDHKEDNETKHDFEENDFEEDDMLEVIIDNTPSSRETCARPIDEMVNETLMSQFYTGMFP